MKKDMKKWMFDIMNSGSRYAMPIMTYPGLELTKRSILDIVRDGTLQYEAVKALSKMYPSIAAATLMDLSVEAEAFGCPVRYSEREVPTVTAGIVHDMKSVDGLKIPGVGAGRTGVYLLAAHLASENIEGIPVFGRHIGPISLAVRLFGMSELMIGMVEEPEVIHLLLEKCTAFLIEYEKAFRACGANGCIIAEPAAGLLSPEHCDEFSSQYVRRIVKELQGDEFMVILHNCGKTVKLVPSMLSTGAAGLHFGNAVDMRDIMRQIPSDRLAFGNIDPAAVFRNGTAEDMESSVWTLLENTAAYKNFVLSSGCDVPPGTSFRNVDAFYNTLERFNRSVFGKCPA